MLKLTPGAIEAGAYRSPTQARQAGRPSSTAPKDGQPASSSSVIEAGKQE